MSTFVGPYSQPQDDTTAIDVIPPASPSNLYVVQPVSTHQPAPDNNDVTPPAASGSVDVVGVAQPAELNGYNVGETAGPSDLTDVITSDVDLPVDYQEVSRPGTMVSIFRVHGNCDLFGRLLMI